MQSKDAFRDVYRRLYQPDKQRLKWVKPLSCSAVHEERSAFHQYEQMPLLDLSRSDEETMDAVLEHCMPCMSCTRIPLYPTANLFRPRNPSYVVSRHALDGWCPQNHMDCAAAGLAGAISAALDRKRGALDHIQTLDVVMCMKRMAEQKIEELVTGMEQSVPQLPWHKARAAIAKVVRYRKQMPSSDIRFEEFSQTMVVRELEELLAKELELSICLLSSKRLVYEIFHLCKLKNIETFASHRNYEKVVESMGLGLEVRYTLIALCRYGKTNGETDGAQMKIKESYTWEELKTWVGKAGVGVIAFVPCHLVMVFATGEDLSGPHPMRHVLIGRISGGQSPCSWIPFEDLDLMDGETGWVDSIDHSAPAGEAPDHTAYTPDDFLAMSTRDGSRYRRREIGIVKMAKKPAPLADFICPSWLPKDDVLCASCCVDKGPGDTKRRDKERRKWLGL